MLIKPKSTALKSAVRHFSAPIEFQTTKVIPFNAQQFYGVIKDVDRYAEFLSWMTSSVVDPASRFEEVQKDRLEGGFEAETRIGFNAVSFAYVSKVTHSRPLEVTSGKTHRWRVTSVSPTSTIFTNLMSNWKVLGTKDGDTCQVDYQISMEFASPLYASVTTHFFDYLIKNVNQQFEERTAAVGPEYSDQS